jgi:hypothetical protein
MEEVGGLQLGFTDGFRRDWSDLLVVTTKAVWVRRSLPFFDGEPMSKACILCFVAVMLACLSGCGKKETPAAQAATAQKSAPDAAPPPQAPPQQTAASAQPPPPAAQTYDAVVVARSIDYFRGQVTHKNWEQARAALKQVEGYQLTPEQRQYVDGLKAQIPGR